MAEDKRVDFRTDIMISEDEMITVTIGADRTVMFSVEAEGNTVGLNLTYRQLWTLIGVLRLFNEEAVGG